MRKKLLAVVLVIILCMASVPAVFAAPLPKKLDATITSDTFSKYQKYMVGETIRVTPSAKNATSFKIALWKGQFKTGSKIMVQKNIEPGKTMIFSLTNPGIYTVHLVAFNSAKEKNTKDFSFKVVKRPDIPSELNAEIQSASFKRSKYYVSGENISITPSAKKAVRYNVSVWKGAYKSGTSLLAKTNVAPGSSINFNPTSAGTYTVHMDAYNLAEQSASKDISFHVNSNSSSGSTSGSLSYKQVRYKNSSGKETSVWYAVIPANVKMHYAYGKDTVLGRERPSSNAKRHNAVLAVNCQLLGFPTIDGKKLGEKANVKNYDFYVELNKDSDGKAYNAFNVYGVSPTDPKVGISFKDINLGFDYEGNWVKTNGVCSEPEIYMALFEQVIKKGKVTTSPSPYISDTHPRTWIAYDSKGTQYVAVCAGRNAPLLDGTQLSQYGFTYKDMIEFTRKYMTTDIQTLYNLDGGGSCSFVYNGEKLSPNYDNYNKNERANFGVFYWK